MTNQHEQNKRSPLPNPLPNPLNDKRIAFLLPILLLLPILHSHPNATAAPKPAVTEKKYKQIAFFSRVLNFVETQYANPVDTEKLINGAIQGMLQTLDSHSSLLNPEIYRQMKMETSGTFGGIGIDILLGKDGLLTISHSIENTPAWKAGIMAQDKIIKINGEETKGLSLLEAATKMRGKNGTAIELIIYRSSSKEMKKFKVVRSVIKIPSVHHAILKDNIAYIRLSHFQEKSSRDIKRALNKMEKKEKLSGLILDLRNNPGGLLSQAVEVTNLFLDSGTIVSIIGRNKELKEVKTARSGMARKNLPLAILVNGNSASAAEIVAGALKDHNRALILGSRTFGKGSVQQISPIGNKMGLKLTIAAYHTPNGISIHKKGINPHILLDDIDPELFKKAKKENTYLREADLKRTISGLSSNGEKIKELILSKNKKKSKKNSRKIDPHSDYQVQKAASYLQGFNFFERFKGSSRPRI